MNRDNLPAILAESVSEASEAADDGHNLGPVDKPSPNTDASEQDESDEAGGEFVISSGDAPLLLEMTNEALNP